MRRNGFTLIELLVVIAIIAILAAILFPVFARARAKAHQTTCLSQHKQIAAALLIYIQDYDERFPGGPGTHGWWFPGPEGSWQKMPTKCCGDVARFSIAARVQTYIKSDRIFQCPSDPTGDAYGGYGKQWEGRFTRRSYAWPTGVGQGWEYPNWPSSRGSRNPGQPITLAEVNRPEFLWISEEAIEFHSEFKSENCYNNMGFADGHAKYTRWVDPWVLPTQRSYEWNAFNPRRPVDPGKPCEPTCAEEAARN